MCPCTQVTSPDEQQDHTCCRVTPEAKRIRIEILHDVLSHRHFYAGSRRDTHRNQSVDSKTGPIPELEHLLLTTTPQNPGVDSPLEIAIQRPNTTSQDTRIGYGTVETRQMTQVYIHLQQSLIVVRNHVVSCYVVANIQWRHVRAAHLART